ncbi:MAG: hypothetical protein KC656_27610, partial [Myxococcales bacterium]|nr:hypothetical protein [Myxococcales bacterium]
LLPRVTLDLPAPGVGLRPTDPRDADPFLVPVRTGSDQVLLERPLATRIWAWSGPPQYRKLARHQVSELWTRGPGDTGWRRLERHDVQLQDESGFLFAGTHAVIHHPLYEESGTTDTMGRITVWGDATVEPRENPYTPDSSWERRGDRLVLTGPAPRPTQWPPPKMDPTGLWWLPPGDGYRARVFVSAPVDGDPSAGLGGEDMDQWVAVGEDELLFTFEQERARRIDPRPTLSEEVFEGAFAIPPGSRATVEGSWEPVVFAVGGTRSRLYLIWQEGWEKEGMELPVSYTLRDGRFDGLAPHEPPERRGSAMYFWRPYHLTLMPFYLLHGLRLERDVPTMVVERYWLHGPTQVWTYEGPAPCGSTRCAVLRQGSCTYLVETTLAPHAIDCDGGSELDRRRLRFTWDRVSARDLRRGAP